MHISPSVSDWLSWSVVDWPCRTFIWGFAVFISPFPSFILHEIKSTFDLVVKRLVVKLYALGAFFFGPFSLSRPVWLLLSGCLQINKCHFQTYLLTHSWARGFDSKEAVTNTSHIRFTHSLYRFWLLDFLLVASVFCLGPGKGHNSTVSLSRSLTLRLYRFLAKESDREWEKEDLLVCYFF